MKKQILIIAFFVLALMAGSLSSFGQLNNSNIAPAATTCTSDALHPRAGQSYSYTIDNTNGVVPTDYSWWITKNPQFIVPATGLADQSSKLTVASGDLIATTALGAADGKTIDITWSPGILAKTLYQGTASTTVFPSPTFVAVMANGTCTNNLQVYEINPKPSFTVDLANIDAAASSTKPYGTDVLQCVSKVAGANYVGTNVTMNYGTNTLYYEMIAANFTTSFRPTFTIQPGSLVGTQTADIFYASTLALAKAGTYIEAGTLGLAVGGTFTGTVDLSALPAITNTANGVSLYIKVVIHNNSEETLVDLPFTLAVDAQDKTGQWDLVNSTCADPAAADKNDTSTQTVTRRPDITNAIAPAPAPAPATFIPKN